MFTPLEYFLKYFINKISISFAYIENSLYLCAQVLTD